MPCAGLHVALALDGCRIGEIPACAVEQIAPECRAIDNAWRAAIGRRTIVRERDYVIGVVRCLAIDTVICTGVASEPEAGGEGESCARRYRVDCPERDN